MGGIPWPASNIKHASVNQRLTSVNPQNPLLTAILRQVFCKLRTTALPHDFSFVFLEHVS